MKVNVELDLCIEEEKEIFEELSKRNGAKLKVAMWDFAQEVLRQHRKYGVSNETLADIVGNVETNIDGSTIQLSSEEVVSRTIAWVETHFYEYLGAAEAEIE